MRFPLVATRDCSHCLKYYYDEKTGRPTLWNSQPEERLTFAGPGHLAPCRDPERGCAKGTAEKQIVLSAENRQCYRHYLECKAVGDFPKDWTVRRNAAIIRRIEEDVERDREDEIKLAMLNIVSLVKATIHG